MVATLPFNRVAAHYETPEPELPKSARERGKLWSDTVFLAVLTLRKQLRSSDAHVAAAAAESILELERTRMRHCKQLAGSEEVSEAQEQYEAEQEETYAQYRAQRAGDAKKEQKPVEVKEKPAAPPEAKRRVSPALAEHAREARRFFETTCGDMTEEESLQFTIGFFRSLGRKAEEMPKEEFRTILKEMSASIDAGE